MEKANNKTHTQYHGNLVDKCEPRNVKMRWIIWSYFFCLHFFSNNMLQNITFYIMTKELPRCSWKGNIMWRHIIFFLIIKLILDSAKTGADCSRFLSIRQSFVCLSYCYISNTQYTATETLSPQNYLLN